MQRGGGLSPEEQRRRRRRRLAAMSPDARKRRLRFARRHNEKDGRLLYCDYCDLFVSAAPRSWRQHIGGARHMDAVEGYYAAVAARDPVWMHAIREDVARAHVEEHVRRHQRVAGKGAAVPLPPVALGCVGVQGIVVGGIQPQQQQHDCMNTTTTTSTTSATITPINTVTATNIVRSDLPPCGTPSVRVAGRLVAAATPPVVKVDGKALPMPPVKRPEHKS